MDGEELKRYRKQKKWTQQQLADRLGVSRVTIGLYEIDRYPIPQSKLNLLNLLFNIPIGDEKSLTESERTAILIIEHFREEFALLQQHLGVMSDRQQKTQKELKTLIHLIKLDQALDDDIDRLTKEVVKPQQ